MKLPQRFLLLQLKTEQLLSFVPQLQHVVVHGARLAAILSEMYGRFLTGLSQAAESVRGQCGSEGAAGRGGP